MSDRSGTFVFYPNPFSSRARVASPAGNTRRANVGLTEPMTVPDDLARILAAGERTIAHTQT